MSSTEPTTTAAGLAVPLYERVEGGWKCGGPVGCGDVATDLPAHSHAHGIRHEKFCAECRPGGTDE